MVQSSLVKLRDRSRKEVIYMIEARIEGRKLIITADLEHPVPSKSGKTLVVALLRPITLQPILLC